MARPTPSMHTLLHSESPLATALPHDALHHMLACHERMRHFGALARHLGEAEDASPEEHARAASQLLRFFSLGLPLHVDDEDHSLMPLLLEGGAPRPIVKRLWELDRQHYALDTLVDALLPLWSELREDPSRHAQLSSLLREGGRRLAALSVEHLALEEEHLYPVARERLSGEDLRTLASDMRRRRHLLI
ncbi:hemerythrin domain-containing protein [Myxococcaceae bacterium GXIMD 01537]